MKESKNVVANFELPDGTTAKIQIPPKRFKTGREGYYTPLVGIQIGGKEYGGQIQFWEK